MRHWVIAAMLTGQLSVALTPVRAADLVAADQPGGQRLGAIAAVRLRVPLDRQRRDPARLALTAAPTLHMLQPTGERRIRIGEGFELAAARRQPLLTFAGQPISRLADGGQAPDGPRRNISTIGWVAIGVGALAVLYVAAFAVCQETNCTNSD